MAYEKEEIDGVIKEFLLQRFKDAKPDIINDYLFEKHKDLKKPEDWDFNTTFTWLTTPYNRTESIDYPWYNIKEIFDVKLLHVGAYYVLKKPEEENEK